jgi:di/tricarboxylate transporter
MTVNKGNKAVKILILTPLATTALSLLMLPLMVLSTIMEWNTTTVFFYLFMVIGVLSVTVGLLMMITGVILSIKQKKPRFIVLGSILIVFMLIVDSYLYWVLFINEADTRGPQETMIQQTVSEDDIEI